MKPPGTTLLGISLALLTLPPALAQDAAEVEIMTVPVAGSVSMLRGQGGNIGVSVGKDGAFLIDDQFAPLTEKILAAVGELTDAPVRFVLNTHWHGDHTGGNENLGNAGALIVAHDNVRVRMSSEQFMAAFDRTVPPSPPAALPVVTFAEGVTFHLNGDEIEAFHPVTGAHTDGDTAVHFREADVIHAGDLFFNGFYPFIDLSSGGSVTGLVEALGAVLERCGPDTRVIPGHGPLSDCAELEAYRDMLATIRDRVAALMVEGKTRDEMLAAAPSAEFDAQWGQGFIAPERFLGSVWDSLAAE